MKWPFNPTTIDNLTVVGLPLAHLPGWLYFIPWYSIAIALNWLFRDILRVTSRAFQLFRKAFRSHVFFRFCLADLSFQELYCISYEPVDDMQRKISPILTNFNRHVVMTTKPLTATRSIYTCWFIHPPAAEVLLTTKDIPRAVHIHLNSHLFFRWKQKHLGC